MKKILSVFTLIMILLSFGACEAKDNKHLGPTDTRPKNDNSSPDVRTIWTATVEEAAELLADEEAFWDSIPMVNENNVNSYKKMRTSFLEDGFLYKPVYDKEYQPENSKRRYGLICNGSALSDDVLFEEAVNFHVRIVRLSQADADYETIKEYFQTQLASDDTKHIVESSRKAEKPREQIYLYFMEPFSLLPYGMPGAIERINAYYFLDEKHYVMIGMQVYPGKATEEMMLSFIDGLSFEKVPIPEVKPMEIPLDEFLGIPPEAIE